MSQKSRGFVLSPLSSAILQPALPQGSSEPGACCLYRACEHGANGSASSPGKWTGPGESGVGSHTAPLFVRGSSCVEPGCFGFCLDCVCWRHRRLRARTPARQIVSGGGVFHRSREAIPCSFCVFAFAKRRHARGPSRCGDDRNCRTSWKSSAGAWVFRPRHCSSVLCVGDFKDEGGDMPAVCYRCCHEHLAPLYVSTAPRCRALPTSATRAEGDRDVLNRVRYCGLSCACSQSTKVSNAAGFPSAPAPTLLSVSQYMYRDVPNCQCA